MVQDKHHKADIQRSTQEGYTSIITKCKEGFDKGSQTNTVE